MKKMMQVLIVDDEPDAIEFVKAVLDELDNINFISAENGKEGLKSANTNLPDLVILDVLMPGIDGFSVFNELRKNERTKNIPIIMLTGVADKSGIKFIKEDMKEYFGEAPVEYLEKPLDPDKLLKVVSDIFEFQNN